MTDNTILTFGMYKDRKLANVPGEYLLWLLRENKCSGELKDYILDNKEILLKEAANNNKFLAK